MNALRCFSCGVVATAILLFANASFSEATAKTLLRKKTNPTSLAPAVMGKPDLELKPLKWSRPPKQGDVVGRSAILHLQVVNRGQAPSRAGQIQIRCTSMSGGTSPSSMNGTLDLASLNPGKSLALSWPSMSAEKWPAGTFKISVHADSLNAVHESNEYNNKKQLIFTVQPRLTLKPAEKVQLKKTQSKIAGHLALIDYDILSVKSDPTHPHTREYITVVVKVKNKTPKPVTLPFYFKCKPLDGGTCPDAQPGREIIVPYNTVSFNAHQTREIKMFHNGNDRFPEGRYLLAAAKDNGFKTALVFTVMTVQAPEDVPVRINTLKILGTEIPPSGGPVNMTTQPQPMGFEIMGGGFNPQSKVYYQNTKTGGNIWSVDDPHISADRITGKLPVSASNVAGSYRLWVKNSNGDQTAKYRFNLLAPGSPPQIYEWAPKTITSWQHWTDVGNGRWAADVTFKGKNLSAPFSDHWVESNSVSDHLNLKAYKGSGFYRILFTTGTDYPPQDGEIKIRIYNKHPDPSIDTKDNGQWFMVKVRNEPVVIDPPTILQPEANQTIALKDITVVLKDPAAIRVMDYELEWKKKAGNFLVPAAIMDGMHKSVDQHTGTMTIPITKFDHEGVYRFRARVKRSTKVVVKPDPQWSGWREFKVLRKLTIGGLH